MRSFRWDRPNVTYLSQQRAVCIIRGAEPPVRGRRPRRPLAPCKRLVTLASSGTTASRAEQGSAPPYLCRICGGGKSKRHWRPVSLGLFILILLSFFGTHAMAAQWGGELRFCIHSEPRSLHPALADSDAAETIRYLTGGVLVRVNRSNQQLEPELANSWKVENGGKS